MTNIRENQIAREGLQMIRDRLPRGWSLDRVKEPSANEGRSVDIVARARVKAPDGKQAVILIEVKNRLNPSWTTPAFLTAPKEPALFIVPFLSQLARQRLKNAGLNFADLTGNVRLQLVRPGLFLETTGASIDPSPARPKRSLKGAKVSRVVRTLVASRPPLRLKELAQRANVDVGHVSRLLKQLTDEGLLSRSRRGPITEINWEELIRQWAEDYKVTKGNTASYFLAPRGLDSLIDGLRKSKLRYALTGSFAAAMRASVAPAKLAMIYVDDRQATTSELDLRPADVGGNVVLLVPRDSLPFEDTSRDRDLVVCAPAQVAVDLLTGPGRSSSEAEAFIDWMKRNENGWRR